MPLTKNQKRMVAVLGVSLLGLVVDQFILPSPAHAPADARALLTHEPAAAQVSGTAGPEAKPTAVPATRPAFRWGARHLGPRLLATTRPLAAEAIAVRDAFHSPVLSAPPPAADAATSTVAADRGEAPVDPVQRFLRDHQLRAVIASGPASMALVNDLMVRPGQSVSGFRLISVENTCAVFEGPDASGNTVRVRLPISDPAEKQSPG